MCHSIPLGFGVQRFTVPWTHSGAEIDACVLFTERGNTVAVQLHISAAVSDSATATVRAATLISVILISNKNEVSL